MLAAASRTAFSFGCAFSASTAASAKNGRKESLTPSLASNAGPVPVPEPGDRGHVRLDHGGQLGGGLQGLHHPLGDHLAGPGQPLGAAALAGRRRGRLRRLRAGLAGPPGPRAAPGGGCAGSWRRAGRRSRRRGRGRIGLSGLGRRARGLAAVLLAGRVQHVLLADPAADAGAGHRARSMPCSEASLRTSGVTYALSAPSADAGASGAGPPGTALERRPPGLGRRRGGGSASAGW